MARRFTTPFTGDPEADELLASDALALLLGMLLDQQVPMEWAFRGPRALKGRLGGRLDAGAIAAMDPEGLREVFGRKPPLHRYWGSMADRAQTLCRYLAEHYDGEAERVWRDVDTGEELFARLRALPGFGDQKSRIFTAVLAKRLGVAPPGWGSRPALTARTATGRWPTSTAPAPSSGCAPTSGR